MIKFEIMIDDDLFYLKTILLLLTGRVDMFGFRAAGRWWMLGRGILGLGGLLGVAGWGDLAGGVFGGWFGLFRLGIGLGCRSRLMEVLNWDFRDGVQSTRIYHSRISATHTKNSLYPHAKMKSTYFFGQIHNFSQKPKKHYKQNLPHHTQASL